jgi:hypothetical protein
MTWIRRNAKTIGVNIVLTFAVVGLFTVAPIAGVKVLNSYTHFRSSHVGNLLNLPNYADIEWAEQYFIDQKQLRYRYSDFVTWSPKQLATPTINIDNDGRRMTHLPTEVGSEVIWIFGGSTVWGLGVDDANTIPSFLAGILQLTTINYGVNGYTSRQDLAYLIQIYSDVNKNSNSRHTIVFYGGLNDSLYSCRTDKSLHSTIRQASIQKSIDNEHSVKSGSVKQILRPSFVFLDQFMSLLKTSRLGGMVGFWRSSSEPENLYGCDSNTDLASQAAQGLVYNWKTAQTIVEANGDRFIGILQPVSAISDTRLDHLPETLEFDKQYQAVYPYIRVHAGNADLKFHDLSRVLDRDEYFYIDDAHVTPNGNKYIAQALADLLS